MTKVHIYQHSTRPRCFMAKKEPIPYGESAQKQLATPGMQGSEWKRVAEMEIDRMAIPDNERERIAEEIAETGSSFFESDREILIG